LEFDDAPDAVEASEFELDGCEDVERCEPRELVAFFVENSLPACPWRGTLTGSGPCQKTKSKLPA